MFLFIFATLFNYSYAKNHGNGIVIHKEHYNKKSYDWSSAPNVIVCKDSPYKKETVEKAVAIWKKEGIDIGNVYEETNSNKCDSKEGKKGYIQIYGYRNGFKKEDYFARTWDWRSRKDRSKFWGAEIEFRPNIKNSQFKLLVHELGHTLGFKHYEDKYDIMNR